MGGKLGVRFGFSYAKCAGLRNGPKGLASVIWLDSVKIEALPKMAFIKRFRVDGLAGRSETCTAELNDSVNVCFGLNGSGKTSLLKILHSALSNNGETLKQVPFTRAEVVVHSYYRKTDYTYILDRNMPVEPERARKTLSGQLSGPSRIKRAWTIDPEDGGAWHHTFLPTTRLYRLPSSQSLLFGYKPESEDAEERLEASFVDNLSETWKDYSAELAREAREVQEAGLARILISVITPPEPKPDDFDADAESAYNAVSQFLKRTQMSSESPSEAEFLRRYHSDAQLKSVSGNIKEIERRIEQLMAPRAQFKAVVNEMFAEGKSLTFDEKEIKVTIGEKKIALATLSSGEKHLLRILIQTIAAGTSPMLVDEPELSLHVDWQRRLIPTMRTLNRSSQMVFATHSPEIMADLPDSDIFRI